MFPDRSGFLINDFGFYKNRFGDLSVGNSVLSGNTCTPTLFYLSFIIYLLYYLFNFMLLYTSLVIVSGFPPSSLQTGILHISESG